MGKINRYEKEDKIIIEHWKDNKAYVVEKLKPKSVRWVMERACNLGVGKSKRKVWTPEEDAIIIKYWNKNMNKVFEYFLESRSYDSINKHASRLGIAYDKTERWTPQEDDILVKYYRSDREKAFELLKNRTRVAISRRAYIIGSCNTKKGTKSR